MSQISHGLRYAGVARRAADVPVLPAVVATARDAVAAGKSARRSHCARGYIGSVLAKAHHLGAGNQPCQVARPVALLADAEEKNCVPPPSCAVAAAFTSSCAYPRILGSKPLHVVDVFVAVHVPDAAALAPLQKNWSHALHVLRISLAERLRAAGNHFFRTVPATPATAPADVSAPPPLQPARKDSCSIPRWLWFLPESSPSPASPSINQILREIRIHRSGKMPHIPSAQIPGPRDDRRSTGTAPGRPESRFPRSRSGKFRTQVRRNVLAFGGLPASRQARSSAANENTSVSRPSG